MTQYSHALVHIKQAVNLSVGLIQQNTNVKNDIWPQRASNHTIFVNGEQFYVNFSPFTYYISIYLWVVCQSIGTLKSLNNALNGGSLKMVLFSSLISTQHNPTFGHSISHYKLILQISYRNEDFILIKFYTKITPDIFL